MESEKENTRAGARRYQKVSIDDLESDGDAPYFEEGEHEG